MPRVTACACHARIACRMHAGKPATLIIRGMPGITYGHAVRAGKQYLSKIATSHFSTLNTKFANQNMLKRIPIAMLNENKAVGMRTSGDNNYICGCQSTS